MTMPDKIDRYHIIDELGQGGFAIVYLAHDPRLNRKVALKLLKQTAVTTAVNTTSSASPKTARERFEAEAQILVSLEFDGIVRIYDYGDYDGRPFLVMQYMPGGTLAEKLSGKPLPVSETAVILKRLCASLDKVHQRHTIHRDLKPLNILFDAAGEAYLSDFGIARLTENSSSTVGIGTPRYMAPEQFQDDPLTIQTDIYQMGVTLFEMLTGETPFNASTNAAVMQMVLNYETPSLLNRNPDLKPAYDDVIRITLAKNPANRYQYASDMARHFEALVSNKPVPAGLPIIPPLPAEAKPNQQADGSKTRLAWLFTAVLLIPLFIVGFLLIQQNFLKSAEPAADAGSAESPQLNIVLVTATAVPGSQPLLTASQPEATANLASTQTAAALEVEVQNQQATQTSLGQQLPAEASATASVSPTATPFAAISTQDVVARQIREPIYIDGDLSEWPPIIPVLSDHIVYQHNSWDGSEDLVVSWQLTWDAIYLYLAVTAVDDVHVQTQSGNQIFKGDSVSLQIDSDRAADLSEQVSPDDFQIDISPGDFAAIPPSAHRFRGNNDDWMDNAPGHTIFVQAQQTETGYTLEAAIPWADLSMIPFGGQVLGLSLNASDNDTPDTAVQELFLSNVPDRQFNTPNSWGTLILQGSSVASTQPLLTATRTPVSTATPSPTNYMVEDFEYSSASALEDEYWTNSPGNVVSLQLVGTPHNYSGQKALAVNYQLKRDTNDYVGVERNLTTPMDWSNYQSICFWLSNSSFTGFIIFQFQEQGSETWKYQAPLNPNTTTEICLALNDDEFSIDSAKLNNIMDLTAVANYAIYLGEGGVTEGTIYIDAVRLK